MKAPLHANLPAALWVIVACAHSPEPVDSVAITTDTAAIEDCEFKGAVALDQVDPQRDRSERALRIETAGQGGNVLLVDSPTQASRGSAYFCQQIGEKQIRP